MRTAQLLRRNLTYYRRTNLSVLVGVATAVAVLAGALLVGDSVRASLRDLFLQRLGRADYVISAPTFFRAQLASDLVRHPQFKAQGFSSATQLIALRGTVLREESRRQGGQIVVYGVDESFWEFHQRKHPVRTPQNREVLFGERLAHELGVAQGESLLLRVQRPSDIPIESLHGRKEDPGRTLRLTVSGNVSAAALGEFSLQPQQGSVRAVFVPLALLQKELDQEGKVNTILISQLTQAAHDDAAKSEVQLAELRKILDEAMQLDDFGIKIRPLESLQSLSLETESKLVNDQLADDAVAAAAKLDLQTTPILAYLANRIVFAARSVPYSLVAAIGPEAFAQLRRGLTETRGRGDTLNGRSGEGEKGRTGEGEKRRNGETEKANTLEVSASPSPRVSASPRPPVPASPRPSAPLAPIILNDWTARDLGARVGDEISLEYYLWHEDGRLETRTAQFQLTGVVPITGLAADRELVPEYAGITESEHLSDWDPPFPIDLSRVRRQDEDYWEQFRTTPKAFIQLERGQQLWQSRFGKLTSLRVGLVDEAELGGVIEKYSRSLRDGLYPEQMGIQVIPARAQGLQAAKGATDFGEYFLYFSFFLVSSALLLTVLFFKLGVEQRLREIGTLEAIGFSPSRIRNLFISEGILLSVVGTLIGLVGAIVYGQLLMYGLRTWWVGAVGTTMLTLHVNPFSLILGGAGGVLAAVICIVLTLRRLAKLSTRSLLLGAVSRSDTRRPGDPVMGTKAKVSNLFFSTSHLPLVLTVLGIALLVGAALGLVGQAAGFFGGGTLLLIGILCYQSVWLRQGKGKPLSGAGWWPVSRLGFRNTTYRPGRSIFCIALIASAAFIIVAVDAFRRDNTVNSSDKQSGSGGFPLLAESLLPVIHDPNSPEGREALNLTTGAAANLSNVSFTRFRVRAGDDASCLNLYRPSNPKLVAADDAFIRAGRFTFQNSLASASDDRNNPWLLLTRDSPDGTIPVIGDANSLSYVLHLKLGDELTLNQGPAPVRLRIVGALRDSIFQNVLIMAEKNLLRLFPEIQGHQFFLIDTPDHEPAREFINSLEDRLSDYGFDVIPTNERLAEFHRVENTYLSTFQLLGGLGIVLGTLGMAAVLLRNVLERRRELALLRAVGYNFVHFTLMVMAENAFLLFCGLVTGTLCALLAVAPVFFGRGGEGPNLSLGVVLLLVLISGLVASLLGTLAVLRSPLLPALKAE